MHHLVTLFAYIYCLATRELGGVMVQGLLFELPVLFMLRRETHGSHIGATPL